MSSSTNTTGDALGGPDSLPPAGASGNESGLAELITLFASLVDAQRLALIFLTWVAYDFCLTIDDSVDLFWSYQWSMAKCLYLISRYDTLIGTIATAGVLLVASPSQPYCTATFWTQVIANGILILVMNISLAARVQALWNRVVWVRVISLVGLIGNIATYFTLVPYTFLKGQIIPSSPPFIGCILMPGYDKTWIIITTGISYETIIIGLTIYQSWSVARQSGVRTPLYTLILGDGIIYYMFIMASQILTLITSSTHTPISLALAAASPSVPVTGIACSRLFTRLQCHLIQKNQGVTSLGMETSAGISFGRYPKKTKITIDSWMTPSCPYHNSQENETTADKTQVYSGSRRTDEILRPNQTFEHGVHFQDVVAVPGPWNHEMQDRKRHHRYGHGDDRG